MSDLAEHLPEDAPEPMTQTPTTASTEAGQDPAASTRPAEAERDGVAASEPSAPRRRGRPRKSASVSDGEAEGTGKASRSKSASAKPKAPAARKAAGKKTAGRKASQEGAGEDASGEKTAKRAATSKRSGKSDHEEAAEKKPASPKRAAASRKKAAVKGEIPEEGPKVLPEEAGSPSVGEPAGKERQRSAKPKGRVGRPKKEAVPAAGPSAAGESQPEGREVDVKASHTAKAKTSKASKATKARTAQADKPSQTVDAGVLDAETAVETKSVKAGKTAQAIKEAKDVQAEKPVRARRSRKKAVETPERQDLEEGAWDRPVSNLEDRPSLAQQEQKADGKALAISRKTKTAKADAKVQAQSATPRESQASMEPAISEPDRKQEEAANAPRPMRGPRAARRKAQEQALRSRQAQEGTRLPEAEKSARAMEVSDQESRQASPSAPEAVQVNEAQVSDAQQPAERRAVRRRTRRTHLTSPTPSAAAGRKDEGSQAQGPVSAQDDQASEVAVQQQERSARKGEKPVKKASASQPVTAQAPKRKTVHQGNAPSLSREDLSAMKIAPLREKARQLGLNPQGIKKADLVELVYKEAASQEGFRSSVGILDITNDGYGFLRCDGYMPSSKDCFVIPQLIKQYNLRPGDELEVETVPPRGKKNSYPPVANISKVNGRKPEDMKVRPKFKHLTPVYPDSRLVMEDGQDSITGRAIDIVAPIGKGQRGLIVSPPKAGKTTILKKICASIAQNNPDVHLICLLVDERPEEVTDMERSIKGEVVASTFDMPAENHTQVSELVIERAKRLVELGEDVVVILDSITRLARAYNIAQPASGRVLSGGVDSAALYPPKRFLGAARNIEGGGSLTILASALIDTGSKMDEVIFEEFKGTGNMELKLDRDLADKRIYPAIDPVASGTRNEELLLDPEARQHIWTLKRVLANMNNTERAESMLIKGLKQTESNAEFLSRFAKKAKQAEFGDND